MKLYIVIGTSGEYSDINHWLVRAFKENNRAEDWAKGAEAKAKEWEIQRENNYTSPPKGWSEYDPNMKMDYTGTSYFIEEVEYGR